MNLNRSIVALCLLLLLIGAAVPSQARASTPIVVTTNLDNTTPDLQCSLREAITNANNNAQTYADCATGSGDDTISFSDALGSATITPGSTLPDISDPAGLSIDGGGDIVINGNDAIRIFWVDSQLTLNHITVTHGKCTSCLGGGIYTSGGSLNIMNSTFSNNIEAISSFGGPVTISNSTFTGNNGLYGGGVSASGAGSTLTVSDSIFSNNNSTSGGGSAIYTDGVSNVTNSTFSGNTDPGGRGSIYTSGTAAISNSTFANNSSSGLNDAGAIFNQGTLTVSNSTFSGNSVTYGLGQYGGAGDIYQLGSASKLHLYNNILANSGGGGHCTIDAGTADGNNNLVEDASSACGFTNGVNGNIVGSDPNLGTLTGSPAYFPLNSGSLAIDAGDNAVCAATPVSNASQNGLLRPQGAHCDIGSYERDNIPPVVSSVLRAGSDPSSAASVDFNVSFSEPVSGVDTGDFSLSATGVSGASITGVSGSGANYVVSVNTGSGNGTIRLDLIDDDSILDQASNPLGGTGPGNGNYTTGEVYTLSRNMSFNSAASFDGWVLESSENSNRGGTVNTKATTFQLGDDASNRQYRAILSFDTSALPDNAQITSALLMIKQSGAPVGSNPFKVLGKLWADIKTGNFGSAASLQLADFNTPASASKVGAFNATPAGGWYTDTLNLTGLGKINTTGLTQFRVYFAKDDNNNHAANSIKFVSGNSAANQPALIIIYTLP